MAVEGFLSIDSRISNIHMSCAVSKFHICYDFSSLRTFIRGSQPEVHAVAYAENFHRGFHSEAYVGHMYLVCSVCDVTM